MHLCLKTPFWGEGRQLALSSGGVVNEVTVRLFYFLLFS